ncbi:MAG: 6-phosphofructokinase [Clostridia bacterium]|nr:6-phosphofructokinase [Clostridia bacterium]
MKRRIGILTAGGDCPGLNAAIRGVAKAAYEMFDETEIVGFHDGYRGLIDGDMSEMKRSQFSGILTLGGTILGTSRTPFRNMRVIEDDNVDKVKSMKETYEKLKLDCLVTLGGNGTHKTANLLSEEGLNVIGLPKTIDNDIYGTDFTFGFHTAVDIATDVIDRIHTTAASHGRCMVIEIMGNKAGWLTLYSGLAGGADVLVLPEIPYDIEKIAEAVEKRARSKKAFSIIAVAEGAMDRKEAKMKRKERENYRLETGFTNISTRMARELSALVGVEARAVIPGHMQRGGSPSAYDRVLSTQFGVHAAELIRDKTYGYTVALQGNQVVHNKLSDVAGIPKLVSQDDQMVDLARHMGITFGD